MFHPVKAPKPTKQNLTKTIIQRNTMEKVSILNKY